MTSYNHISKIYADLCEVLTTKFPKEAVYKNDIDQAIFVYGDYYFPGKTNTVLLVHIHSEEPNKLLYPHHLGYNDGKLCVFSRDNKIATLKDWEYILDPTISQINAICEDLLYKIKQVSILDKLNELDSDFK